MPIIVQCKKTVLYVMPNGCVVLQYASFTFLLHRQIGSHFGGEKKLSLSMITLSYIFHLKFYG